MEPTKPDLYAVYLRFFLIASLGFADDFKSASLNATNDTTDVRLAAAFGVRDGRNCDSHLFTKENLEDLIASYMRPAKS